MTVQKATTEQMRKDALQIRNDVFVKEQHVDPELEWDEFDDDPETTMFVDYDQDHTPLRRGVSGLSMVMAKLSAFVLKKSLAEKALVEKSWKPSKRRQKKRGVSKLKLGAQVTAIPFYEKLGYEVCSDIFMDAGIEHKEMQKQI
ncbi:GNAT family N-acetyltransferase [Listeria aquatica]|uniref:GNAT family acetyltransferase n=1 Tax=Listeria aquatica FSL S10-1188 TaxID=1265818 RepID=W7B2I6_9LIST|nr:GNAT family N-acetyltransferase [Listeria aquatica]EUJ21429.1 GNAT family acetyltransferase [Listeria aquatica FSL S10-1188]